MIEAVGVGTLTLVIPLAMRLGVVVVLMDIRFLRRSQLGLLYGW